MKLYVDGALVGTNPTTSAQVYTGYWRIGGDKVWTGATSSYFAGSLDEAAVYPTALSENDIRAHYNASGQTAPNRAPVASFNSDQSYLKVDVDGSASTDADGALASYSWNFGDGGTATGASQPHLHRGRHLHRLVDRGRSAGRDQHHHQVGHGRANQAPTAAFTPSVNLHDVAFDASTASDSDGSIANYAWDFGDGTQGAGKTPNHSYGTAGSFVVTLTVTDDLGLTSQVTKTVTTVDPVNQLPTAAFTSHADDLKVDVDGGTSQRSGRYHRRLAWTSVAELSPPARRRRSTSPIPARTTSR